MRLAFNYMAIGVVWGGIALSLCHCGGGTDPAPSASASTSADTASTTVTSGAATSDSSTSSDASTDTGDSATSIGLTAADWDVVSDGEGTVVFDANGILMTPKVATAPSVTHGAWVLAKSTETSPIQNFKATITYTNVAQLRTGSAPNPWEVFWVFFNYTLGSDGKKQTNYVMVKTNGTEMGRAFSETSQEFLVTNSVPVISIGDAHTIIVTKTGTTVTVTFDGAPAFSFTSAASPSTKYIYDVPGSIGLYTEDAQVRVSSVIIESL
jgi:hypothetical protein